MVSNSFCAPGVTLMPIFSTARRFCSRAEIIFLSILSRSRAGREGGGFVETSTTSSFFIWAMFNIFISVVFFLAFLDEDSETSQGTNNNKRKLLLYSRITNTTLSSMMKDPMIPSLDKKGSRITNWGIMGEREKSANWAGNKLRYVVQHQTKSVKDLLPQTQMKNATELPIILDNITVIILYQTQNCN